MKQTMSKKPLPAEPNPMLKLYVGIGFLVIAVVAVLLIKFIPNGASKEPAETNAYKFEKHGTAAFYNNSGNLLCNFDIEIVETLEKQTIGLMYRDSLALNQGMFFPYNNMDVRTFWMKNTYIPLDIIYIGADSTIVSISENTTPFSETQLQSKGPAQFVLEINAGLSQRFKLEPGVKFTYARDF